MKLGCDRFCEEPAEYLKQRPFALVTGSTVIDSAARPVYLRIKETAGRYMRAIWSLQHGFRIDKQDNMIFSSSFLETTTALPVRSLYADSLQPHPDWLQDIRAVVVDVFDVGTRVYTYLNHLVLIMRELAGKNIDVIVLDRPNPLNGCRLEGTLAQPDHFSVVAALPVPMRHGLTSAEYLLFARDYYGLDIGIEVVQLEGWERSQWFGGHWVYPSPNMPGLGTAVVYPGAVLIEGTNLSEGRGTTRPFLFTGSPYLDHLRLIDQLEQLRLPGAVFVPVHFTPEFSKHAGRICRGVMVAVTDRDSFSAFHTYYEMVRAIRRLHPEDFAWSEPPYEFESERLPIDMICAGSRIRRWLEADTPFDSVVEIVSGQLEDYRESVAPVKLY